MSKPLTITPAEQALAVYVLKQVDGMKIDYVMLKDEFNITTTNAARVRWSRFATKLKGGDADITFTETEKELLVFAIKQAEFGKINYEDLKTHIGIPTANAARVRWSRFQKKVRESSGSGSHVDGGNAESLDVKVKGRVKKVKTEEGTPKKRKMAARDLANDDDGSEGDEHETPSKKHNVGEVKDEFDEVEDYSS